MSETIEKQPASSFLKNDPTLTDHITTYLKLTSIILYRFLIFLCLWIKGTLMVFVPKFLRYKNVSNETVLITGGGSGVGRELCKRFASLGAKIVIWDLDAIGMEGTKRQVKELYLIDAKTYLCDVSNSQQVYATADQVRKDVGDVSILINNAGIVTGKKLLSTDDDSIRRTFNVNSLAHFWTCKAFLGAMRTNGTGHIVTIASLAGLTGGVQLIDYCASKFAAVGFAESLRLELQADGFEDRIHTTLVCPFFINTGMFDGVRTRLVHTIDLQYAVNEIMAAILVNQKMLVMPKIFYTLNVLKSFWPVDALDYLFKSLGGYEAMSKFSGRNNNNENRNGKHD